MREYIVTCDEETASWIGNDVDSMKPVVRCRDCKHFKAETKKYPASCRLWLPRNLSMQYGIIPDGFCAWGERRSE